MRRFLNCFTLLFSIFTMAQNPSNELPYKEIPEAPKNFTAGTVASRMVDGLGFRFYWATDSLTEEDLALRPSPEARSVGETLEHIYRLSKVIVNAATGTPTITNIEESELDYETLRAQTLRNLKEASGILKESEDLSLITIELVGGDSSASFPFWNAINGPIADAIWHCGQIASFRRMSGNPIYSGISQFLGSVK